MERSKQNKHAVCNKGDGVDNDVDNGNNDNVYNGDDDGVDDCDYSADKHLAHLSQAADCCLMGRSKQNKHVVCDKDNDVDNGDNDNVDNGDDGGVDGADKHLAHLSQAAD
eukprot:4966568-Ditylum_brightwellii.AAC.1